MNVLVDFDNIEERDRRAGLLALTERIAATIGMQLLQSDAHLRIRFYGGWFREFRRSPKAQEIAAEVKRCFPTTIILRSNQEMLKVLVNAELAEAIVADPTKPLYRTYRARVGTAGIRCKWPGSAGCKQVSAVKLPSDASPQCPLSSLPEFMQNGRCPTSSCQVTVDALLHRNEQKLIDTMLVSDLIYLAFEEVTGHALTIVSSDDDMIPGIRTAVKIGVRVLQIYPTPRESTESNYTNDIDPSRYSKLDL